MIDDTVLPVTCEGYNFAEESAARAQREREQLALWVWDDYWQGQLNVARDYRAGAPVRLTINKDDP